MFYEFRQNNSGGGFDWGDTLGINVIIEAPSSEAACARLEELGGYFNGVDAGTDCDCCGDRWSTWCDESPVPSIYARALKFEGGVYIFETEYVDALDRAGWVHFLDGRKVKIVERKVVRE